MCRVITYSLAGFAHCAVADSWDIENPERITLPTYDPSENFDVKCIAAVGNQVWIGAGPSIFILDGETLNREVCYIEFR